MKAPGQCLTTVDFENLKMNAGKIRCRMEGKKTWSGRDSCTLGYSSIIKRNRNVLGYCHATKKSQRVCWVNIAYRIVYVPWIIAFDIKKSQFVP
jgi:hypothetical protein